MIVTEVKDTIVYKMDNIIKNFDPLAPPLIMSSGVPRSDGLHLTKITGDLFGYGERDPNDTEGTERMATGFALEYILSWAIGQVFHTDDLHNAGILVHAGEVELDGIKMSPDAVWVYDDLLEEFKATWTSSNKPITERTTWLWQTKAYCLALGLNKVRFRILHVNGSYHKGTGRCANGPCFKTWLVTYTDEELQENWKMIVSHAKAKGWL